MMEKYFSDHTDSRWVWLSTLVALVLLLSLPVFVALLLLEVAVLASLSQGWFMLYSTAVLMALVYTFGREALRTVYQFRNGGFSIEEKKDD